MCSSLVHVCIAHIASHFVICEAFVRTHIACRGPSSRIFDRLEIWKCGIIHPFIIHAPSKLYFFDTSTRQQCPFQEVRDNKVKPCLMSQVPATPSALPPGRGEGAGETCCDQELSTCAQCKVVRYCSKACQMSHWKMGGHRHECAPPVAGEFWRFVGKAGREGCRAIAEREHKWMKWTVNRHGTICKRGATVSWLMFMWP